MSPVFRFQAEVWEYEGQGAWHFVTVPLDVSEVIADLSAPFRRGFGSVRVSVAIGRSKWKTSVFPSSQLGLYILPVKKSVRSAEDLVDGSTADITLTLEALG